MHLCLPPWHCCCCCWQTMAASKCVHDTRMSLSYRADAGLTAGKASVAMCCSSKASFAGLTHYDCAQIQVWKVWWNVCLPCRCYKKSQVVSQPSCSRHG